MWRRASRPAVEGGILPPEKSAALTPLPGISKALMISHGFFRRLEARLYVSQDG